MGNDSFDFYGEEEEITDLNEESLEVDSSVSAFSSIKMSYPFICIKQGVSLKKHKWEVLSKVVSNIGNGSISVYLYRGDDVFCIGKVGKVQMDSLIQIIGLENLFGYYREDKKLEGEKLYVLC